VSIPTVGSNQTQTIGSTLLQQLMAEESSSQGTSGDSGVLGDLMSLSPAAQQLTQAPDAVTQAMGDLFSGKKDVQGDLALLQSYFQQNPQNLASLLSSLQGGAGTYSASNSTNSNSALLTALMNGQSNASNPSALLGLLSGNQGQNTLFNYLGDSSAGSDSSALSILG
jgi:lipopolysaccharide biosynthesis regulator YciM